jgi:hypothetical protein
LVRRPVFGLSYQIQMLDDDDDDDAGGGGGDVCSSLWNENLQ